MQENCHMTKGNFRLMTILSATSLVYKQSLFEQNLPSSALCFNLGAFREGHNTQQTVVKLSRNAYQFWTKNDLLEQP